MGTETRVTDSADIDRVRPWLNVILRANLAASAGGPGILTFRVMIDEFGRPCPPWTSPKITHLEPRGQAENILSMLNEMEESKLARILELLSAD
jgi:hypothetical protein